MNYSYSAYIEYPRSDYYYSFLFVFWPIRF